jgi:hypothetical protein
LALGFVVAIIANILGVAAFTSATVAVIAAVSVFYCCSCLCFYTVVVAVCVFIPLL